MTAPTTATTAKRTRKAAIPKPEATAKKSPAEAKPAPATTEAEADPKPKIRWQYESGERLVAVEFPRFLTVMTKLSVNPRQTGG